MSNPFDYVNAISENKVYNFNELDKEYNQYVINKAFSYYPDTIFLVNEANRLQLQGKMHYDFLYHVIPKRKRYSKWYKGEDADILAIIQEYYSVNINIAKEYRKALSDNDIEFITQKLSKGGKE